MYDWVNVISIHQIPNFSNHFVGVKKDTNSEGSSISGGSRKSVSIGERLPDLCWPIGFWPPLSNIKDLVLKKSSSKLKKNNHIVFLSPHVYRKHNSCVVGSISILDPTHQSTHVHLTSLRMARLAVRCKALERFTASKTSRCLGLVPRWPRWSGRVAPRNW